MVGAFVVGLFVGFSEMDGLSDGRDVGMGVVGVGALEDVGATVGMACMQSRTL